MFELQTAIFPQKSLEIIHLNAEKKGSRPEKRPDQQTLILL
jgi:hypothetical protein